MTERLIVDASAMVELLVRSKRAASIRDRLRGHELHVPAHFDAGVLSAMGRLHRSDLLTARQVGARVGRLAAAPLVRHLLAPLLAGAWRRRHNLRFVDALYVELASQLDAPIVTTDAGLAGASGAAEYVPG